jgi:medium-chain acyl-[acyl-carrier-protein] hydrolase
VVRLLCLHHAGAGASSFRDWSRALPDWIEVVAVQLPGREGRLREPPQHDLRRVALELADNVGELFDRPIALFGHSMGALLGFELACVLRSGAQADPLALFLAGYGAPHVYRGGVRLDLMPPQEVRDHLRETGAAPAAVLENRELIDFFVPIIQADVAMCAGYVHDRGALLRSPISAFGGRDDAGVPLAALRGWADLTTAEFRLRMLDGGHYFPTSARCELLRALTRDLAGRLTPAAAGAVAPVAP